jgi:hypothetical protein
VRVYLPATLSGLRSLWKDGGLDVGPRVGYTVTPALREWFAYGGLEELEYAALTHAARASLRLLDAEPAAPRRRVVLAVDVPDSGVSRSHDQEPSAVLVAAEVPLARVAAVHVDATEAEGDVAAAAAATRAADAGDDDAAFVVDGAEGHELLWYASQEIPDLLP